MKCLNCNKRKAQRIEPYGYLYCKKCLKRGKRFKVKETIENTTDEIQESRKKYAKDILQRYQGDTPSAEYIKVYGRKGFTDEQVRRAQNVWGSYYSDKTERINPKSLK